MADDRDVLTIGVNLDTRAATQGMLALQREIKNQFKKVTQTVDRMGKANSKVAKQAVKDAEAQTHGIGELAKYYKDEVNQLNALQTALSRVEQARKKGDNASQKAAKKQAKAIKKEIEDRTQSLKDKVSLSFDADEMGKEARSALKDAGEDLKGTLSSFFSKDLKGIILGAGGIGGSLTKALGKGLAGGSAKLTGMGTAMGRKEGAGIGAKTMGKGLKGLGSLGAKLGPLIGSLAKLGPALGLIGAGIAGLVKLFIDADAQAKEFQKSILQSASTTEYLTAAGRDADVAYADLGDDMKAIRDAAYSWDNQKWGISNEQHTAVLNTLTQQGKSLYSMRKEAEAAGQKIGDFTAQLTHVSVAYSRHFGVPLQEISELQAELMTEMGMGLDSTTLAFSQMTRSATESGIASNKFFAMIRGVSQDLSNYNVRMGSAVKLLGMLGKVMNPRNAQKFMQGVIGTMKNMGQDERLKVALLAGGKGKKIVEKDLKNKRDNLYRDVAGAIGKADEKGIADVKARLEKGGDSAAAVWAEVKEKGGTGALREQDLELTIDETASKKGVYGQAFAMENLGAGATVDIMTAALAPFTKSKTLMGGAGELGMTKMAETLGIGTQQLRGMMKLEVAVKEEKEALLRQGEKDLAAATTEKAKAAAREKIRLGTEGTTQDILDTMSEEQQKLLKEGTKSELDYAKEQGKLTMSMSERLQVLIDFLMNQLYNVLLGIWDSLTLSDKQKLAVSVSRTKDPALMKLLESVGGDPKAFKEALNNSEQAKKVSESLTYLREISEAPKRLDVIKNELTSEAKAQRKLAMGSEAARAYEKQLLEEQKELHALLAEMGQGADVMGKLESVLMKRDQGGIQEALRMGMENAGIKNADSLADGMAAAMKGGQSTLTQMLERQGRTPEEIKKIIEGLPVDMHAALLSGTEVATEDPATKENTESTKIVAVNTAKVAKDGETTATATGTLVDKGVKKKSSLYVRFGDSFLSGPYKKTVEEAVLAAIRVGLFEYYMYSALDREAVAKYMKSNKMSIQDFADKAGTAGVESGKALDEALSIDAATEEPKGKQHGGLVSHIGSDGLAIFRTPPGEGITGIGPGERIVPAYAGGGGGGGGGGSRVVIALAPDAQRLIQAEVQHGIIEHERRRKTAG